MKFRFTYDIEIDKDVIKDLEEIRKDGECYSNLIELFEDSFGYLIDSYFNDCIDNCIGEDKDFVGDCKELKFKVERIK